VSVFTIEEVEYNVERLLRIIEDGGEGSALTVLKKTVTGDDHPWPHPDHLGHGGVPPDRFCGHLTFMSCRYNICTCIYCISAPGDGKRYS
jgi:hypothetical protein